MGYVVIIIHEIVCVQFDSIECQTMKRPISDEEFPYNITNSPSSIIQTILRNFSTSIVNLISTYPQSYHEYQYHIFRTPF